MLEYTNMGGGKVGLASDTEANLWFKKKEKRQQHNGKIDSVPCVKVWQLGLSVAKP